MHVRNAMKIMLTMRLLMLYITVKHGIALINNTRFRLKVVNFGHGTS